MVLNNIINRIKSINSNIKFVGSFDENNQKTGYWEYYNSYGNLCYKGIYVNGIKDGNWEIYWSNGNLRLKGKFENNFYNGYWEWYYPNGDLYRKGNYINGILHVIN